MPYRKQLIFLLCQFNEAMETTLNSLTSLFRQFPLVSCSSEMTFVFSANLNVIWPFKPPRTQEFEVYTKFVTSVTTKNIDRNLMNSNRLSILWENAIDIHQIFQNKLYLTKNVFILQGKCFILQLEQENALSIILRTFSHLLLYMWGPYVG